MIGAARGPQGREYQLLSTNTFTTGGTQSYSIPNGTRYLFFQMWGGGGGGAGGRAAGSRPTLYYGGGGGGGGGYCQFVFWGGDGYGIDDSGVVTNCDNFDMQPGDTIEFFVGGGGAGGNAASSGAAGQNTRLIAHKRNGVVVLDHDALTGYDTSMELYPSNYLCASSYLYSLSMDAGYFGTSPTSIPSGGSNPPGALGALLPDRRQGLSGGANGSNNSGTTTASPGGTGGRAGGTGGAGGTAGPSTSSAAGGAGVAPGGGGGGGGSSSAGQGVGGRGATGQVIIRAYG